MSNAKRKRPRTPTEFKDSQASTLRAKKRAYLLLDRCLGSYCLEDEEANNIMLDVCRAFYVSSEELHLDAANSDDAEMVKTESRVRRYSYRVENMYSKPINDDKALEIDGSNEFCEVCDKEGNLLCCDTCSLVFHLGCLRPKLDSIPEGSWSCPFCIVDGLALGDVDQSIDSISKLKKLCQSKVGAQGKVSEQASVTRLGQIRDQTGIHKSSGRYVIKKPDVKGGSVELGRYWSLEEALRHFYDGNHQQQPQLKKSGKQQSEPFCGFCMNDPFLSVCVFCGCKVCHLKAEIGPMLTCVRCKCVYHAACEKSALPLAAGAEEGSSTWKCAECIRLEPKKAAVVKPAVVKPAVVKPAVVKPASSSSAQSTEPVDQAAESVKQEQTPVPVKSASPVVSIQKKAGRPAKYSKLSQAKVPSSPRIGMSDKAAESPRVAGAGDVAGVGTNASAAAESVEGCTREPSSSPAIDAENVPDEKAVTLDSIMKIIAQISLRPLTEVEKGMIQYFRRWSPLHELEIVLSAMQTQRDELKKRFVRTPEVMDLAIHPVGYSASHLGAQLVGPPATSSLTIPTGVGGVTGVAALATSAGLPGTAVPLQSSYVAAPNTTSSLQALPGLLPRQVATTAPFPQTVPLQLYSQQQSTAPSAYPVMSQMAGHLQQRLPQQVGTISATMQQPHQSSLLYHQLPPSLPHQQPSLQSHPPPTQPAVATAGQYAPVSGLATASSTGATDGLRQIQSQQQAAMQQAAILQQQQFQRQLHQQQQSQQLPVPQQHQYLPYHSQQQQQLQQQTQVQTQTQTRPLQIQHSTYQQPPPLQTSALPIQVPQHQQQRPLYQHQQTYASSSQSHSPQGVQSLQYTTQQSSLQHNPFYHQQQHQHLQQHHQPGIQHNLMNAAAAQYTQSIKSASSAQPPSTHSGTGPVQQRPQSLPQAGVPQAGVPQAGVPHAVPLPQSMPVASSSTLGAVNAKPTGSST